MQKNGDLGHSETLAFFSDGDGDFRPQFKFLVDDRIESASLKVKPHEYTESEICEHIDTIFYKVKLYDAG